jgi:hypothetical protein
MSVFQCLWLVICLVVPATAQNPLGAACVFLHICAEVSPYIP